MDQSIDSAKWVKDIIKTFIETSPDNTLQNENNDKATCLKHLFPTTNKYVKSTFGFDGYGCGHCQTGVPCESKIPTRQDVGEE